MKKKAAIFTIVKDEDYFLPIWIKYYSQYFNKEDIYILDHNTVGDSTKNLECNVIRLNYDELFNHQWLCSTVKSYQKELLEKYEVVVFTEIDEILFSTEKPFNLIIEDFYNSNNEYITCLGYELIQDLKTEKPLTFGDSIAKNRKYWMHEPRYNKTLVSKIPLDWAIGFHDTNYSSNILDNFYMAHLHFVDANNTYYRYINRIKSGGKLNTNIISEKEWERMANHKLFFEEWPHRENYVKNKWDIIPEKHLSKLNEYGL
jgi:hypothetical protein